MNPRLISPVPVVLRQTVTASTVFDPLAREPVKQVSRAPEVTVEAQVSWGFSYRSKFMGGGQGGGVNDASGYLVLLRSDLDAAGVELARGDRVLSIGGNVAEVYLTERTFAGHHDGTHTLEVWDFNDHPLTRQR